MKYITQTCKGCGGAGAHTGEVTTPEGPAPYSTTCIKCNGAGKLPLGELSDDFIDFINDLKGKIYDIFEKVNE